MQKKSPKDPYLFNEQSITPAPDGFRQKLKYLGPGFILSASVVGSGELIATTSLGAKAGFVTLWLILWVFKPLQLGGIIGGVAIILNIAIPALYIAVWTILVAFVVISAMLFGFYEVIEKISMVFMGLFTVFTLLALFMVQNTEFAVSWPDIAGGLSFKLPRATVGFAFAAFGLTGVGGDEILSYNYWCIEKGYARYAGEREDSAIWKQRAKGWIRVMYMDAFLSMIVYTVVTAAFFLLGASILYQRGEIPEGYQMIETISRIYTDSVGPTAKNIFLLGSFMVLFSTLFAALAIRTRVFSDLFGVMGWIDFSNMRTRLRTIRLLAIIFPALWTIAFLVIKLPVLMVTIGGIATFVMLFIVVFAGIRFRFGPGEKVLPPGRIYKFFLIISCLAIFMVGIYGIVKLF